MSSVSVVCSTVNMRTVLVIVFCVGNAILSVKGNALDEALEEILKRTTDILIMYDVNMDTTVPFKDLKLSLKALEAMAKDYHGESSDAIYTACDLGTKASDNYFRATDTIFTWCVKARRTIKNILYSNLEYETKFIPLLTITNMGVNTLKESLTKLNQVTDQLTDMSAKLRPVPSELTRELVQPKEEHLKRVEEMQKLSWGFEAAAVAIIAIVATSFSHILWVDPRVLQLD